MLFESTNIEQQLQKIRSTQQKEHELLEEVRKILCSEDIQEVEPLGNLEAKPPTSHFNIDLLETQRIYHITHIKKICIDYRLRFLDYTYFKGKLPKSATSAIQRLEAVHNTTLKDLKIIAPSRLFKLEDKDDPLLFAPLGNQYFYLIHKWGNDLHPLRKLWAWPFKHIKNLTLCILLISYVATLMIPSGLFSKSSASAEFWILYAFMFKSIAAVVIFYGFALGKNFNPAIWNSKYFNA